MSVLKLSNEQNVEEFLTITQPVLNKKKRLSAYMLYDGETFSLRMPTMLKAPFGVKEYSNNGEGADSYSLNVSAFPLNKKNKDSVNDFFDAIEMIDKKMIDYALNNSEAIFGKGKKYKAGQHEAVVEALYTPTVKTGENKDGNPYPRRLQAKIRGKYDEPTRPNLQVYLDSQDDINDESFTFANLCELIPTGTFIDMICQPNIWFINGRFGITWNVRQVKIHQSKKATLKSYAFSDHDDSDDDNSDADENSNADDNSDADENSNADDNSDADVETPVATG